jgi:hypothetical protein
MHLFDSLLSTWRPHSRLFPSIDNYIELHSLLTNTSQVAEKGSNYILKVETTNGVLDSQLMIVLPGPENANIQRLEDIRQMRRKLEELDMVLSRFQLEFVRLVRLVAI